jgi:hypothetical protein
LTSSSKKGICIEDSTFSKFLFSQTANLIKSKSNLNCLTEVLRLIFVTFGGKKMFLKKNKKNLRSLFTIFAVLGLATTMLWWGADTSTINAQTTRGTLFDFTGNGRTDWTTLTFPAATGQPITWKVAGNPANPAPNAAFIRIFNYGNLGDNIIPGDFIGDNKNELVAYRQGTPGIFYVAPFLNGPGGVMLDRAVQWGTSAAADNPNVSGDYDGDGKLDYTVVRIVNNNFVWYIMSSSTNMMRAIPFGTRTGVRGFIRFYGADFTGDGRDELVFLTFDDAKTITYHIGDAVTGAGVITRNWGNFDTDISLSPADYTGDGKADLVAVRQTTSPATWYINNPATNAATATAFGIGDPGFSNNDRPVRGDYDGDGKHDIAVWRPSNQTFYVLRSTDGGITGQKWGDAGDVPLGATGTF